MTGKEEMLLVRRLPEIGVFKAPVGEGRFGLDLLKSKLIITSFPYGYNYIQPSNCHRFEVKVRFICFWSCSCGVLIVGQVKDRTKARAA